MLSDKIINLQRAKEVRESSSKKKIFEVAVYFDFEKEDYEFRVTKGRLPKDFDIEGNGGTFDVTTDILIEGMLYAVIDICAMNNDPYCIIDLAERTLARLQPETIT